MTNLYRPTNPEASQPQQIQSTSHAWHLPELSLYITDSCALSCTGCISFNNFALGGHLSLTEQVRERVQVWSSVVSVDRVYIIGGEPLSHPELAEWMKLVEQSWPRSRWTLVTNGRGLAERTEEAMTWIESGWDIEISSHSREDFDSAQAWWQGLVNDMLEPTVARRGRDQHGVTDYWEDSNGGAMMQIGLRDRFYTPNYRVTEQGTLAWNALTGARVTHSRCPARACTHLVDGIMYNCPVQATLPRLAERYTIEGPAQTLAQEDLGYDPLARNKQSLSTWMSQVDQPKSQCSLCEWPKPMQALGDPTAKKIKLVRRDSPATALEHPANPDVDVLTPTASNPA